MNLEQAIFYLFVVGAYVDLRVMTMRLHKRVSAWEHCHIRCKPEDAKLFN